MLKLAEQIIADILSNQMDIDSERIWLRSQNRKIPEDDGLFIVVGMVDSHVLGVNKSYANVDSPDTLSQSIGVMTRDNIQIDLLSRNTDAIFRRWEILTSLASLYSVQQQELYQFKIFRLPSNFVDASGAEGGSNINRFTLTIPCHVWYSKESNLAAKETFNIFDTRVDDAVTIGEEHGIIEFTISQ